MTLTPTAPHSETLRRYQRLRRSAFGKWRFARATSARRPLLALLHARFEELNIGVCRASMSAHRGVRGADGTIDSIAIGALAQMSADMVIEVSAPPSLQWSARGLTIEHLSRAATSATALARLDKTDWAKAALVGVPVTISDASGNEVARAVVSFAVATRND